MIDLSLKLDYTLAPGWQQPWIEALGEGIVLARRCIDCTRTSYVPLRVCDCSATKAEWVKLSGTATIVQRSTGTDGDFALARFDGADTLTVVRLIDVPAEAISGHLLKPGNGQPALLLGS